MEYRYTGIILSKRDVGETDRLYNIFTFEAGKILCLAKGVRKSQAKLAGFLENYILTEIFIAKNQGMGKIKGSLVENNFPNLRKNYDALMKTSKAVKILDKLLNREDKEGGVFLLLRDFLYAMDKAANGKKEDKIEILYLGFVFKLFEQLGYKIKVDVCAGCEIKLSSVQNFFSPESGGILCSNCSAENKINILNDSIKIIRIFYSNKIESLLKLKTGKKETDNLNLIANIFYQWIS
jgi:DNA repair protein RecO (recombination protein O)